MIINIIHSGIIVIHPVINMGVSFTNIYHEYNTMKNHEEKMDNRVLASQ